MTRPSELRNETTFQNLRAMLLGPQLAALLPAIMLGAYWFGGEGVLLTTAVIFPALLGFVGLANRAPRQPHHDSVEGLPGRSQLIRRLDDGIDPGRHGDSQARVALVLALDDFAEIESRYGATGAEAVQRAAVERLRFTLRDRDFIAGLGDGRFGLALAKTHRIDIETMLQLAARMQSALSAPLHFEGNRVPVTASIGFALPSRVPDQTGDAYLHAAESALAEAVRAGPGAVRAFGRGMRPRIAPAESIADEVAKALESGQIRPWFQPQISTDTGALTGFEALARWQHPEKGTIAPAAFLPAIAGAGLQQRLGEVVLFHSLTALRDWDRAGFDVPQVAVNLSPEELQDPQLCDRLRWELDRFDLTPGRLTIEVLETVVSQPEDDITVQNIAALARLGCSIDLDDFGTGNASIGHIRQFHVNRIKIDRSFVTHVDSDPDQQNMVAAILTMAEQLGIETIGEGVETHGEHAMLAQLGCGHVQGYSIAKPMPFEQASAWITRHRASTAQIPALPRRAG